MCERQDRHCRCSGEGLTPIDGDLLEHDDSAMRLHVQKKFKLALMLLEPCLEAINVPVVLQEQDNRGKRWTVALVASLSGGQK